MLLQGNYKNHAYSSTFEYSYLQCDLYFASDYEDAISFYGNNGLIIKAKNQVN